MGRVGKRVGSRGIRMMMIDISESGRLRGTRTRRGYRSSSRTPLTPPEIYTRSRGTGGRQRRACIRRERQEDELYKKQMVSGVLRFPSLLTLFCDESMYASKFIGNSQEVHIALIR